MGTIHGIALLSILGALSMAFNAQADTSVINQHESAKILGRATGASVQAEAPAETKQLRAATMLQILGVTSQALQAFMSATDTAEESPYAEYYAFGKRIFSENFSFEHEGFLQASVGLSPVEVRIPVYTYPVGPLLLQVGAGVRFQADLDGQLTPTIWASDLKNSTVGLKLTGEAMGSGFLEGYASLIAVRAGVGGEVDLLEGKLQLDTTFYFNGNSPQVDFGAVITFLNGRFYAFADYYQILRHRWKRYWNWTFFDWDGFCYAYGSLACGG